MRQSVKMISYLLFEFTASMANIDRVASKKPIPELSVNTTKQISIIFTREHSLKKEPCEATASVYRISIHSYTH